MGLSLWKRKLSSYYKFNFERMFLMNTIFYWSVKWLPISGEEIGLDIFEAI